MTSPADIVLLGRVHTMDREHPAAEGVAVRGGRIAAVGGEGDLRDLVGPRTEVVTVGGAVIPGFQDAHVHPPHAGLERMRCDLNDAGSAEAYLERVHAYATARPDRPWILGGGWAMACFPGGTPGRGALDAVVAERPAYLTNRDGHGAWVNTRALEAAGIDARTPDPPDGRIERDPDGTPSGTLHEGAMNLVERVLPPVTPSEWEDAILIAQQHLHSLGITAWQDAWVTPETLRAYRTLAEDGRLSARVVAALWWDRERGEEQVADLVEQRQWGTLGRLRATTAKVMQDGVPENFTAGMLDPYLGPAGRPDVGSGLSFLDPEALRRAVTALERERFQVHVHAIGDRAVREALDAFEAAHTATTARDDREGGSAGPPADLRHHIAHLQVVHPDDIARFAALGVVANIQPLWACLDDQMRDLNLPILGPERAARQYPFASLLRVGARLAMGSDWSVTTANPLPQIEVAVTRVPVDERDREPFLPSERLDVATALEAFTLGSAYVNHLDDRTGSIAPGKLADLTVLDRDPLDPESPDGLRDIEAVLTLVEGEVVYAA